MAQWLLQKIRDHESSRSPDFAFTSAVNWMAALSLEISKEHGAAVAEQKATLQRKLQSVGQRQSPARLDVVFESLFASMNFATALISSAGRESVDPWETPGFIVTWYYSTYTAVRAMLAARGEPPADKHAKVIATVSGSGLRADLPHPFDMVATRIQGKRYEASFPSYPAAKHERLGAINGRFDGSRDTARQMLLEYISGTAENFEAWKTEVRVKKQGKWDNFLSKAARQARDAALKDEINFLNCAYRYRGKSNYRDAIYLSYGGRQSRAGISYVRNMANVARFIALTAMEYVGRRLPSETSDFHSDMADHYPGLDTFEREL